jgi:hypothetical protein
MYSNDYSKLVKGEHKNLTGIIFLIGTLMGFFYHTKRMEMDEKHTFYLLIVIIIVSIFLSRI